MAGYNVRTITGGQKISTIIVGTAETAVLTIGGVNTPGPNAQCVVSGFIEITPGTSTTAVQIYLRQGTDVNGMEVDYIEQAVTAGSEVIVAFTFIDTSPGGSHVHSEVANGSYTISVEQVNATANGEANNCYMTGIVF